MFKLFSIREANELLPVVGALLDTLQDAVNDSLHLRQELGALPPVSLAARNKAQELGFVVSEASETKAQLDRLGVYLQDVDGGLVDFPSQLGAEVVCLSWQRDQDSITHYHRLSNGARLPLPESAQA